QPQFDLKDKLRTLGDASGKQSSMAFDDVNRSGAFGTGTTRQQLVEVQKLSAESIARDDSGKFLPQAQSLNGSAGGIAGVGGSSQTAAANDRKAVGLDWSLGNTSPSGKADPLQAGKPATDQPVEFFSEKIPTQGELPVLGEMFRSKAAGPEAAAEERGKLDVR